MASLFSCKFDTKSLKPALNSYLKKVEKAVNKELNTAAKDIASQAKANCTIPSIRATIQANKGTVTAGQGLEDPEIAAYHEFGTGDFARSTVAGLPEDWIKYAAEFIKNGQGRLPASPYLYRAYWSVQRNLNLQDKVNSI